MINLSDELTAKTVDNILGQSKEIEYHYGDANAHSEDTVASNLNDLNDEIVQKVNIGDIVGNPVGDWEQGTVEQYIDNKIHEQDVEIDRKLSLQQAKINTLNGNECVVVDSLPSTGSVGIIYRVPGKSSYSDYMWDISLSTPAFKKLAEYTYPGLDDVPTSGSTNFVKSGGVFDYIADNMGAFDVTAYNSGTTYSGLTQALSAVPTEFRKGGMEVRYVRSSDGKYMQYRYTGTSVIGASSTFFDTTYWTQGGMFASGESVDEIGIDEVPTSGSTNLVESGGVFKYIADNTGSFDVSAYNSGTTYSGLTQALSAVPTKFRKGGMSVRFVQSVDNKYVQYRYMGTSTASANFTNTANWQGVDDEPTLNSKNLVESGGVYRQAILLTKQSIITNEAYSRDDATTVLADAYIADNGKITRNQYSRSYRIRLFTLSAGLYKINVVASYPTLGLVGLVDSPDDLVVDNTVKLVLGANTSIGNYYLLFTHQVYLAVLELVVSDISQVYPSENVQDFYDALKNIPSTVETLNDDVETLNDDVETLNDDVENLKFKTGNKEIISGVRSNEAELSYSYSYGQKGIGYYTIPSTQPFKYDRLRLRGVKCSASMEYRVYEYTGIVGTKDQPREGVINNRYVLLKSGTLASSANFKDYDIDFDTIQDGPVYVAGQTPKSLVVFLVSTQTIYAVGGNQAIPSGKSSNSILFSIDTTTETIWSGTWHNGDATYKCFCLEAILKQSYIDADKEKDFITRENLIGTVTPIVEEEAAEIFDAEIANQISVQLPNVVNAIVGTELNFYNDAIALSIDRGLQSPLNYKVLWTSDIGMVCERCWCFTPVTSQVGNSYNVKCRIYSLFDKLIVTKDITINVLAKNALNQQKTIVYFGDSLGASVAAALRTNFNNTEKFTGVVPNMVGTKGINSHYEAAGGQGWSSYATAGLTNGYRASVSGVSSIGLAAVYSDGSHNFTVTEVNITEGTGNILLTGDNALIMPSGTLTRVSGSGDSSIPYTDAYKESANPLWDNQNNRLDINVYKQKLIELGQLSSLSDKIDAVSFQFGINDNTLANNLDTLMGYINSLYNLFVNDNPNCKVLIGLTTTSGNTLDGAGVNYGASFNTRSYALNVYKIREFYLTLQNSEQYPNIRIAPINAELDRYYGYALSSRNVSQRCNVTEDYHTNFVHPDNVGYGQMADAYFASYVGALVE